VDMWEKLNGSGPEIWWSEHDHDIAYDEINGYLLYYDGWETWSYNVTNESSEQIFSNSPQYLNDNQHAMSYSPDHDRTYLFGGMNHYHEGGDWSSLPYLWEYSTTNRTLLELKEGPTRQAHAMVYDNNVKKLVIFGGVDYYDSLNWPAPVYQNYLNDTWIYDPDTNQWIEMEPVSFPEERVFHKMAYDTNNQKTVMFGGARYLNETGLLDDTWIYDSVNNIWENRTPLIHPSQRAKHTMLYDAQLNKVLLFGGGYNESWTYNISNNYWSRRYIENGPNVTWCQAEYDNVNNRIILYNENEVWTCTRDQNSFRESGTYVSENITCPLNDSWNTLFINKTESPNTHIKISILNAADNSPISGFENIPLEGEINISSINSAFYPSIRLKASFTSNGKNSPALFSWAINWKERVTSKDDGSDDDTPGGDHPSSDEESDLRSRIILLTVGIVIVLILIIGYIYIRNRGQGHEKKNEEDFGRIENQLNNQSPSEAEKEE